MQNELKATRGTKAGNGWGVEDHHYRVLDSGKLAIQATNNALNTLFRLLAFRPVLELGKESALIWPAAFQAKSRYNQG
ncbi:hypothetical protein JVX88_33945 [Leptolyngbya sp. 7M]|nr:hypothetical protein JVX88_33945 [Leptolyngbya sp. 7M]